MVTNGYLPSRSWEAWKYGLVGGLTSILLALLIYGVAGTGAAFFGNTVFFGGILAGYLAKIRSVRASSAGVRAGVIAGLPSSIWSVATLLGVRSGSVMVWSHPLLEAVFLSVVGVALLGVLALAGLLGGMVGGWLSERIDGWRTRGIGG